MLVSMATAVIYTRVSNDQSGRSRSTDDQERECRSECDRQGWVVRDVLCDNDIGASRYSGKDRPAYLKLREILSPGDVLVTWEASRAQRDLRAYVELRDLCAERGVLWSYSGKTFDLSVGDDRFGTGLDALLAEKEAEQIRERVLRGKRAAALAGRPPSRPIWGYRTQRDPVTGRSVGWVLDEEIAPTVRDVITRLLAGESLRSLVRDLTARGIPAPSRTVGQPGTWRPVRLRTTVMSPSYAGLRIHRGEIVGKAAWEPLISEDEHRQLVALLTDPRRRTQRGIEVKHLLSGIVKCGVCGAGMRHCAPASHSPRPRYMCSEKSCVGRRADLVDTRVEEVIVEFLMTVDPSIFAGDNRESVEALEQAQVLRARLAEYTELASKGKVSPESFMRIEGNLLSEISAAEQKAHTATSNPLAQKLAGPDARSRWDALTLLEKRDVIRSLATVTVNKSTVGTRRFNPDDVVIEWV